MSSGLQWTEDYSADYHELIDGSSVTEAAAAPNAAEFVAQSPLESQPGTMFEYSTGTTMLLSGIAADALGVCQQVKDYLDVRLFDPIGITTATLQSDAGGCWYGGFGVLDGELVTGAGLLTDFYPAGRKCCPLAGEAGSPCSPSLCCG